MRKFQKIFITLLTMSAIAFLISCEDSNSPTTQNPGINQTATPANSPSTPTPPAQNTSVETSEKIEFKRNNGEEAFSWKYQADGVKLVDTSNSEIARLTVDAQGKVKIKNATDQTLGYVVPEVGYWKIKNPEQTQELYILRRQADGDYKLEDGKDQEIYRIKQRDYGFEIETPDKQSLYKIKLKGDKLSLIKESDETILYTKSTLQPIAIACFGFDVLTPEQQTALAYAVNRSEGK